MSSGASVRPGYRERQDARVKLQAAMQIEYCERMAREREAAESVDAWTWEPEPAMSSDGLEDLL